MTAGITHPLPFSHSQTTSAVVDRCENPNRARKATHAA